MSHALVVRVILISNVSIIVWFLLHKSHYMSNSKLCVSIDVRSFCASFCMPKTCKKFVKNTPWARPLAGSNLEVSVGMLNIKRLLVCNHASIMVELLLDNHNVPY